MGRPKKWMVYRENPIKKSSSDMELGCRAIFGATPRLLFAGHEVEVVAATAMSRLAASASATQDLLAKLAHQLLLNSCGAM